MQDFVNDEEAIGRWEGYAVLEEGETFRLDKTYETGKKLEFQEIYFLPEGEKYWIFEGWTKGKLWIHYGGDEPVLCYPYEIKFLKGRYFMFLEIGEADKKRVEVLVKTSSRKFALKEIGRRDNIEVPFVLDKAVIGHWKAVAFTRRIEDFTGQEQGSVYLKAIDFYENGEAVRSYGDEIWEERWTKGFLIDRKKSVLSAYSFRQINGKEYLFLEWKMGNYVYGNLPPDYVVFVRE